MKFEQRFERHPTVATYLIITASIEADTDRIIPHLSFENVVPVVTEKSFESWKSGSKDVRE